MMMLMMVVVEGLTVAVEYKNLTRYVSREGV